MPPGRIPNWNIIAETEQSAWLEAVQLASGDRLALPAQLRRRVKWCETDKSLSLLATTGSDGGVTVKPMSAQQDHISAVRAVFRTADLHLRPSLVLAAMGTYSQISLQPDGRLRLSPSLALHLTQNGDGRVWVGAYDDVITLWSGAVWAGLLKNSSDALRVAMATGAAGKD